jgi:hypothetical protein
MISVEILENEVINQWNSVSGITIGKPSNVEYQNIRVGIFKNDNKYLVLNIYAYQECICFKSVEIIENTIVIGFGEQVYFFDVETQVLVSHKLDGYFGYIYLPSDFDLHENAFSVIVASATSLHHYTRQGNELWKSELLGIDGVIINSVNPPVIHASGEWDPPGGWKDVAINSGDGSKIKINPPRKEILDAHKHSSFHRTEIIKSELCGCFNCVSVFIPSKIKEWIDDGECAMCPICGVDTVIGSDSGYPITTVFLIEMKNHWCF